MQYKVKGRWKGKEKKRIIYKTRGNTDHAHLFSVLPQDVRSEIPIAFPSFIPFGVPRVYLFQPKEEEKKKKNIGKEPIIISLLHTTCVIMGEEKTGKEENQVQSTKSSISCSSPFHS